MNINEILIEEIGRRRLSKTEVAKATGLGLTTISEWMNNGRDISTNRVGAIAEFLGFEFGPSEERQQEMKQYLADCEIVDSFDFNDYHFFKISEDADKCRFLTDCGFDFTDKDHVFLQEFIDLLNELDAHGVEYKKETAAAIRKCIDSLKSKPKQSTKKRPAKKKKPK